MGTELKIHGVVETGIYVNDLEATRSFYHSILGLPVIGFESGHHIFFKAGDATVLLAFIATGTLKGDHLPAHGASGQGHFALGIDPTSYEDWLKHLLGCGIPIEKEYDWPRGGKSIYFRDPTGNLVELVTPGIWGLPAGW